MSIQIYVSSIYSYYHDLLQTATPNEDYNNCINEIKKIIPNLDLNLTKDLNDYFAEDLGNSAPFWLDCILMTKPDIENYHKLNALYLPINFHEMFEIKAKSIENDTIYIISVNHLLEVINFAKNNIDKLNQPPKVIIDFLKEYNINPPQSWEIENVEALIYTYHEAIEVSKKNKLPIYFSY